VNCQFAVGSQRYMLKEMGSRKLMMILKKINGSWKWSSKNLTTKLIADNSLFLTSTLNLA